MFLHVTEARYLNAYCIEVAFNNGKKGIAELVDALKGPVFEPLKNLEVFASFKVDPDLETIVWENGVDLAPEFIYYQTFKNEASLQEQFKKWGYVG